MHTVAGTVTSGPTDPMCKTEGVSSDRFEWTSFYRLGIHDSTLLPTLSGTEEAETLETNRVHSMGVLSEGTSEDVGWGPNTQEKWYRGRGLSRDPRHQGNSYPQHRTSENVRVEDRLTNCDIVTGYSVCCLYTR